MCQCEKTYTILGDYGCTWFSINVIPQIDQVCVCVCRKEAKPPDPHLMELDYQHPFWLSGIWHQRTFPMRHCIPVNNNKRETDQREMMTYLTLETQMFKHKFWHITPVHMTNLTSEAHVMPPKAAGGEQMRVNVFPTF